jgi:hypothetical protein
MKITIFWRACLATMLLGASGMALAKGGFVDLDELGATFDTDSHILDNPWWPLPEDLRQIYVAAVEDECEIGVIDVLPWGGQMRDTVYSPRVMAEVKVRTVLDREFLVDEEDCEELDWADLDEEDFEEFELAEITLDWYAQDTDGRIWYFGEFSISLDEDDIAECENDLAWLMGEEGCPDGSWEAGKDIYTGEVNLEVLEGVIMLADGEREKGGFGELQKGRFYFQEYWEDVATDMAKILNFKKADTFLYGMLKGCLMTKEWVPLEPGDVEHKYYCKDKGLVLIQGLSGGPTVWTDLVYDSTLD